MQKAVQRWNKRTTATHASEVQRNIVRGKKSWDIANETDDD